MVAAATKTNTSKKNPREKSSGAARSSTTRGRAKSAQPKARATGKRGSKKSSEPSKGKATRPKTSQYGALIPSKAEMQSLQTSVKRHQDTNTLEGCLELGEVVLKKFYGGSLATFRKLGTRHVSFRKLSEDPEVPVNGLALYRAISIYNVYHQHKAWRYKHNGMSHFRAVLSLPVKDQARLLDQSEKQGWTVNRLAHEASVLRSNKQGERMPQPAFVKALRGVRQYAKKDFHAYADLDRATELDAESRDELLKLAKDLSARFEEIAKKLKTR
ncbi:MAG: hypothetical protein R3B07_08125 [Polyangiaceae bacterium]